LNDEQQWPNWPRLFCKVGLNGTFLKRSSILWGVRQSWGHHTVGNSALLRLF